MNRRRAPDSLEGRIICGYERCVLATLESPRVRNSWEELLFLACAI